MNPSRIWRAARLLRRLCKSERFVDQREAAQLLSRFRKLQLDVRDGKRTLSVAFNAAAADGDTERMASLLPRLQEAVQQEEYLGNLSTNDVSIPSRVRPGVQEFVFSSSMLRRSFDICTETPDEGMHLITGIDLDGRGVGTQIVQFPYDHRSIAGAGGEHEATHRICIQTHEAGHRILSLMHSHPGAGKHANHHSSIDAQTHRQWEHSTRMIGGIWSRDGYLRWFSCKLPFSVQVIGNDMQKLEDNVWRLTDATLEQNQNSLFDSHHALLGAHG